ncbi:MAG TPA: hypothetical protein VJM49_04045 [Acidimicrobiales bacterium]|nr:hypothetical protein [Acidimicrobiales bacterium]
MTDTPSPPAGTDDDAAADDDRPRRRWGPTRVVLTLVVIALVAMWGYVVYLAFGPGRQPPIDRLDDPAFAEAGEERCAEALDAVDELPVASEAPDAATRADVVDRADAVFAAMLDDLDGMVDLAPAGDQRRRATEWLADWRTYLGDREAFADALRTDPDARLLVSEKEGEGQQITGWIDEFAKANRMPSCVTPTDA